MISSIVLYIFTKYEEEEIMVGEIVVLWIDGRNIQQLCTKCLRSIRNCTSSS